MSTTAGELLVAIKPDMKAFNTEVERATESQGDKAGSGMGKKIAGGLVAAFAAAQVGKFIGDSISAASDMAETASKISELFGPAAQSIQDFAKNSATSLGQSKQQALDAAANFAVFGRSAGLSGSDLASFSTELVTTASDMASFHNADPSEVIDAIGSGLRGEAEPLRKYGILMNAAAVEEGAWAYEARTGIALERDKKNQLTATSKLLATREGILSQVGAAEGDFARTSDGLANQQRIMAAEIENAKAELGNAFLPVVLAVIRIIRPLANAILPALVIAFEAVGAILSWVVDTFMRFKTPLAIIAGVILAIFIPALVLMAAQAVIAAAAHVVAFASMVAGWLAAGATAAATGIVMAAAWIMALGPVGLVIAAVVAIVAIFVVLWKKVDGFKEFWIAVWELIQGAIDAVVEWITGTAWPLLKGVFDKIANVIEWVVGVVKFYMALWLAIFITVFNAIKAVVLAVWDWISDKISTVLNWIKDKISDFVNGVLIIWDKLKEFATKIAGFISDAYDKVVEWFGTIISWISEKAGAILDFLTKPYRELWDKIKGPLNTVFTNIKEWIGDVLGKFTGLASDVVQAGKDVVEGLWEGIKSMGSWIKEKVTSFIKDALPGPVAKALGISSPSKVFAGIGRNVVLGLREGIEGEKGALLRDMDALVPEANVQFAGLESVVGASVSSSPVVQVFIGDEEIEDFIVRIQEQAQQAAASRLVSGVGGGYR